MSLVGERMRDDPIGNALDGAAFSICPPIQFGSNYSKDIEFTFADTEDDERLPSDLEAIR